MNDHLSQRVSRVLRSLYYTGYEHMKLPFLKALFHEIYGSKRLHSKILNNAGVVYFATALASDVERVAFEEYYKEVYSEEIKDIIIGNKNIFSAEIPDVFKKDSNIFNKKINVNKDITPIVACIKLIQYGELKQTDYKLTNIEATSLLSSEKLPRSCIHVCDTHPGYCNKNVSPVDYYSDVTKDNETNASVPIHDDSNDDGKVTTKTDGTPIVWMCLGALLSLFAAVVFIMFAISFFKKRRTAVRHYVA
eukprot:GHVR01141471.1.p1 GENE.GHVR01141471.1~~GHVR01141471.1.p1  ORF type:complete len:249 (+),score=65.51 GHVR01141471.1:847-1593(+)